MVLRTIALTINFVKAIAITISHDFEPIAPIFISIKAIASTVSRDF